ncbi:hypothetical protein PV325_008042 [Microctonus aethiopoides]|uniref:UMA domain-containing protein n=1 Tax=Microctonus aethiopoides TaxID=144406 RepID=A0AA39F0C1_9HYME|nr:hypothetical protein PV326_005741 [Microctonus aethiopoides]KAK0089287.1 hypothetical protein PV325_008042 [Microctonus aethiopoides]KAK0160904.1 hypothetical protein PV328_008261 [Microctonus aethiopoides]
MSWLFGKKKHKESPTDSSEEASGSNQSDDYIIVERRGNPFDPNIASLNENNSGSSGNSNIYPFLDVTKMPPPLPSSSSSSSFNQQDDILGDTQTYLNVIQFQLSKQFDNDYEIDRINVDEISSYILRIKDEEYNYDFSLEKSVITEISTTVDEI